MDGIDVYYGEILSEHAEQSLETKHLSYLLCATDNDYYNALVCKAQGRNFGHHRTLQLATHQESVKEARRLTPQQRGYIAFDSAADFETLHERLEQDWTVQTTRLSESFDIDALTERMGELGRDWFLLGSVSPDGEVRLHSDEQSLPGRHGWTLLYFAPAHEAEHGT